MFLSLVQQKSLWTTGWGAQCGYCGLTLDTVQFLGSWLLDVVVVVAAGERANNHVVVFVRVHVVFVLALLWWWLQSGK